MKNRVNPLLTAGCAAFLTVACSQSASNLALLSEAEQKNSEISVYVPPAFPVAAAKSCQAGSVLVEYDVAHSGEVKDDSVRVLADAGSSALADAAVSAVKRWSYAPAYKDGALLERRNLRTAVNFEIEGCEPVNS